MTLFRRDDLQLHVMVFASLFSKIDRDQSGAKECNDFSRDCLSCLRGYLPWLVFASFLNICTLAYLILLALAVLEIAER